MPFRCVVEDSGFSSSETAEKQRDCYSFYFWFLALIYLLLYVCVRARVSTMAHVWMREVAHGGSARAGPALGLAAVPFTC